MGYGPGCFLTVRDTPRRPRLAALGRPPAHQNPRHHPAFGCWHVSPRFPASPSRERVGYLFGRPPPWPQPGPGWAAAMPCTYRHTAASLPSSAPDPSHGGASAQLWPGVAWSSLLQSVNSAHGPSAVARLTSCLVPPCSQMHHRRRSYCGRRCLRPRRSGRAPPRRRKCSRGRRARRARARRSRGRRAKLARVSRRRVGVRASGRSRRVGRRQRPTSGRDIGRRRSPPRRGRGRASKASLRPRWPTAPWWRRARRVATRRCGS